MMNFNPLFIQSVGSDESTGAIKQLKLTKNSYLFADIVKLNYEKTQVGEGDLLSASSMEELSSAIASDMNIEEMMDNMLGMPSLEMFTVVEPKVLNGLVEKVFQSKNSVNANEEIFALNYDINIDKALKSEIYGSEEKLVEFLEQLIPGMAMVDTSNPSKIEISNGEENSKGLSLLPLPEKSKVIEDVLKRLKAGQNVQITAKVGTEKIKLDIQKVTDQFGVKVSGTTSGKLGQIEAPSNETASLTNAKTEGTLEASTADQVTENKTAVNGEQVKVSQNVNELSEKIAGSEKGVETVKNTQVKVESDGKPVVEKTSAQSPAGNMEKVENAEVEKKPELKSEFAAKTVETGKPVKEETIVSEKEKVEIKVKDKVKHADVKPEGEKVEVKAKSDDSVKLNIDPKVKSSETGKLNHAQKAAIKEFVSAKNESNVNSDVSVKESVANIANDKAPAKEVVGLEAAKMAIQNKSVDPLKKMDKSDSGKEKYKIKITQESKEESGHKEIKKMNVEVDNLLNYKKQTNQLESKTNQPVQTQPQVVPEKVEADPKIAGSSTDASAKHEVKIEKPAAEVKPVMHNEHNTVNTKPTHNVERVMQAATSVKEVVKTVKSSQLMQEVRTFLEAGNSKQLVMKLLPESLGKVKVTLDIVDNQMHANVEVESEAVKQVMLTNVDGLKQTLAQSGVQISGFNVSLANQEQQKAKREFAQKKKEEGGTDKIDFEEVTEEVREKRLGYNTYEFTA